jgi:hypothetical protein
MNIKMPYEVPEIEKKYAKFNYQKLMNSEGECFYDKEKFDLVQLQSPSNWFVANNSLSKKQSQLTNDDFNHIASLYCDNSKIMMDAILISIVGDRFMEFRNKNEFVTFEAKESIVTSDKVNDIRGTFRFFNKDRYGRCELREKTQDFIVKWNDNFKSWIIEYGDNPIITDLGPTKLYINVLKRPVMGYELFDLF